MTFVLIYIVQDKEGFRLAVCWLFSLIILDICVLLCWVFFLYRSLYTENIILSLWYKNELLKN